MLRLMQRGDPSAASSPESVWPPPAMAHRIVHACDECGSPFYVSASAMASLCPECAHCLYGFPPCAHELVAGRCVTCGWNGAESAFIARIKAARRGR
jgi:predicted RNA-binding Zn-ribbon protein involved in translation (DUF1610 family)